MNAGVTTAKAFKLRPGIALTAEQVAQLTSDIVWLVEKEVTLPNGRTQRALVPQLYAMVRAGDLDASGALLSGRSVQLAATGDILNSGVVSAQDLGLTAANLQNTHGTVSARAISIRTSGDITVAAGFDAAGQYAQNGTVRLAQSVVAGTTAAAAVPLATRGNLWLPIAGAGTAGLNTTFNNYFYDENTSVLLAAGLGAGFGTVGPALGRGIQKWATPYITNTPHIPSTGTAYIPTGQPRWLNVPGYVGGTVNNTVSNIPSFIPLDNGKPAQGGKP